MTMSEMKGEVEKTLRNLGADCGLARAMEDLAALVAAGAVTDAQRRALTDYAFRRYREGKEEAKT